MSAILKALNNRKTVELKSEVVELWLIDDIKSKMKDANKGAMKAIDMANAAKKPAEQSLKLNEELFKELTKAEKMAKDLGSEEAFKEINKMTNQVAVNMKTIDDVLNALYKI